MCLTVPAQILKIKKTKALVKIGQEKKDIDISLHPDLKAGDWILISEGMAFKKISSTDAKKILQLISKPNSSSKIYEHKNR
jgi:hydrogenase assembly chaperone HypC/HupF